MGLLIQNTGKTQSPVNIYQVTNPSHETSSEPEEPLNIPVQLWSCIFSILFKELTKYEISHKLYDRQEEIVK